MTLASKLISCKIYLRWDLLNLLHSQNTNKKSWCLDFGLGEEKTVSWMEIFLLRRARTGL